MSKKKFRIKDQPIKDFVTFKETQKLLGDLGRGPVEYKMRLGELRFHEVSPDYAKARMIYRPDVLALVESENNKEPNDDIMEDHE